MHFSKLHFACLKVMKLKLSGFFEYKKEASTSNSHNSRIKISILSYARGEAY